MQKKLQYIQILRGIAALLVCCFHGKHYLNPIFGFQIGDILFKKGSIGVPIFFIISGFIMVYNTQKINFNNNFSEAKNFIIKRIIRIIPMYYLITLFWIFCFKDISQYFFGKEQINLFKSFLFIPYETRPVLFLGWTLNYEMLFYFLFAFSILFSKYRFYILFFIYLIILYLRTFEFSNYILKMITKPVIDYFVIGILLGLLIKKIKLKKIVFISLFLISTCLFSVYYFNIYLFNNKIIFLIVSFFTIFFILLDFYELSKKTFPFLVYLGEISFSIYLIHPFIFIWFEKLFGRLINENGYLKLILFLFQLILIILSASILNNFIEKKITKFLNKIHYFYEKK